MLRGRPVLLGVDDAKGDGVLGVQGDHLEPGVHAFHRPAGTLQPIGCLYAAGTVSFALLNSNNITAFSGGIECAQTVAALGPWE